MTNITNHQFKQQGVILPIALVALLIMLIASVGLIRSTDTSLLVSGNLAFKRDALNQAERASTKVQTMFETGALKDESQRLNHLLTENYYASIQPSHQNGLPNILLDKSAFDDQFSFNNIKDNSSQITVRYIVERMCFSAGAVTISNCITSTSTTDVGGSAGNFTGGGKATGIETPVYRLSVRVSGPNNTQAFMQSEFTY